MKMLISLGWRTILDMNTRCVFYLCDMTDAADGADASKEKLYLMEEKLGWLKHEVKRVEELK